MKYSSSVFILNAEHCGSAPINDRRNSRETEPGQARRPNENNDQGSATTSSAQERGLFQKFGDKFRNLITGRHSSDDETSEGVGGASDNNINSSNESIDVSALCIHLYCLFSVSKLTYFQIEFI